ncbi:MAG: hypothetical protein WCW03_00065 [Candidatus Paceibacterota bacterium]|jgi:DNA polymerase III gamma/tau subunit
MKTPRQLNVLNHHAYCLVGSDTIHAEIISILEDKHKVKTKGNSDFFENIYENFTVDDARELKSIHDIRPAIEGGKRYFIVSIRSITVEAQNALLKLFEEPGEYAHFFIIIPYQDILLPTVRSRMSIINDFDREIQDQDSINQVKDFLNLSISKRLEFVKKLADDISKEKKTKKDAISFLDNLEICIRKEKGVKASFNCLENIEIARKYVGIRSPSLKMILEFVAFL